MSRTPAAVLAILLCACVATLAAPAETFKDWALRCPEGAGCVLEQRVLLESNEATPLLHMALQYGGQPRTLNAILRVPLGVLLAPGLTLTIGGRAPVTIPFHHCLPEGCLALTQVSDQLADSMRRGTTAHVAYSLADGRGLEFPLSLYGITAGLRALSAHQAQ